LVAGSVFVWQNSQQRFSSSDQFLDTVLNSKQLARGKHPLLAWFDYTGFGHDSLSRSGAQAVDREVSSEQSRTNQGRRCEPTSDVNQRSHNPCVQEAGVLTHLVSSRERQHHQARGAGDNFEAAPTVDSAESLMFRTSVVGSSFMAQLQN